MNTSQGDYLTPKEAADIARVSVNALAQLRYQKRGPAYLKPSPRRVLYRRADFIEWLESTTKEPRAN